MYQVSKFEMGTFTEGKWYCGCGIPAKWLTSKQDGTKGEKFMRCPRSSDEDCRFFLWEKDEETARAAKSSEIQPPLLPRTPPSNRHPIVAEQLNNSYLPTPNSRDSARRNIFQTPNNASPTPQRYRDTRVTPDDAEVDLYKEVIALLHCDNIVLKSSTEVQLRHIINMTVELYETRVRMYQDTLTELSKKLNDAERGGL